MMTAGTKQGRPVGLVLGALWSVALLWVAARFVQLPVFVLMPTIMTAFLAPGLILMLMMGRMALHPGEEPGAVPIDRQVLRDAIALLVPALCIWPGAAVLLGGAGPGVIATLGPGLAVALLAVWIGAHRAPLLWDFGRAAGFLPTVLAALWGLWKLAPDLG